MLRIEGVCKSFGATVALDGVTLEARAGEVVAVSGENGSGKSTLMQVIAGELQADAGRMWLEGTAYAPHGPSDAQAAGVALIHQELALCPHLSVAENIFLGTEREVPQRQRTACAAARLRDMGYPAIRPDRLVGELTMPMRQVVEIARALERRAKVVIFDEPTSSLAKADVSLLFQQIDRLKEQGCAVLYVSHFLDEVTHLADRTLVLRDGALVGELDRASANVSSIVRLMVRRPIEDMYPRSAHTPGELILEFDSLSGARMPDSASLQIRKGEVVGVAGLNGSGRSELLRTVFGLNPVRSGRVKVRAMPTRPSPVNSWEMGMGFVSEDRKGEGLALNLSIAENLLLPRPAAGLLAIPARQNKSATEWINRLGVKCTGPTVAARRLSGGNQQKVALGRLLAMGADLFLLDEPTRGIDVASKADIYSLIDEAACAGKACLIVSGYLPELLGICDRIVVMHRGRIVAEFDARTATQEQLMEACVAA